MNFDFLSSWSVGMVKACMRSAFEKSKDAHIQIIRKPEMRVIVLKAFKKKQLPACGFGDVCCLELHEALGEHHHRRAHVRPQGQELLWHREGVCFVAPKRSIAERLQR